MNTLFCVLLLLLINTSTQTARFVEIEGHRGARGLAPEKHDSVFS